MQEFEKSFLENKGVDGRERREERLKRLGERLRELRALQEVKLGRKISQRDVARGLGIPDTRYRAYEYGRAELPEARARHLASEWGIRWQDFYTNLPLEALVPGEGEALPTRAPHAVPFIGTIGDESRGVPTSLGADDTEFVPPEMAEVDGRFACRSTGDACYDLIWPGDLCVFQQDTIPRLRHIVLYRFADGRLAIRQLLHDGRHFTLHALNEAYADEVGDGVALGYLVGVVRRLGSRRITVYDSAGITP